MLVRTSRRLAETEASARDGIMAARAETDRVNALLRSDPQVLVAWAAAVDKPEVIGDTALVTGDSASHRLLAFGAWLAPEEARTIERLVAQLRARGEGFATTLTTRNGPADRGGGPCRRRARDPAPEGRERDQARACRSRRASEADGRERSAARRWSRRCRLRSGRATRPASSSSSTRPMRARSTRKDSAEAVERGIELFDRARARSCSAPMRAAKPYAGRLPAIVAGSAPYLRRAHVPDPARQRRHRHRADRSRHHARRDQAHDRGASAHARPARDRRRHLRLRPEAHLLQHRLPVALGPRRRAFSTRRRPTPAVLEQLRARPQAARRAGFPAVEGAAARGLSGARGQGASPGICRTGARCASSPRPIRKAASSICSTTTPSGSISSGATTP